MTHPTPFDSPLLADIRHLIDAARQRVAVAVNAELSLLYWRIGRRIDAEVLQGQRAEYGKQIVSSVAKQLTAEYGKGWSEQQLRHCLRVAETFHDEAIFSTVRRELSWSHIETLIYLDEPLKRDFYIEICRYEHWSVRQLQERIQSMLYERTVISRKPCCHHARHCRPSCISPSSTRGNGCWVRRIQSIEHEKTEYRRDANPPILVSVSSVRMT